MFQEKKHRLINPKNKAILFLDWFQYIFHAASPASPTQYSDRSSILEANILPLKRIASSQSELQELFFISAGETYGMALSDLQSADLGFFKNINL